MAFSNFARLPTAPRRRVVNPVGGDAYVAARRLPQHPAEWEDHGGRREREDVLFTRSPEMMIVAAILKVLSEPQKDQVRRYLANACDFSPVPAPHAPAALAIVEAIK